MEPNQAIITGNIETLLGYKGQELATITEEEFKTKFPDIFNFEKSLRDVAGLIKAELPKEKDPDAYENDIGGMMSGSSTKPKVSNKEKNEAKRAAAMRELLELNLMLKSQPK